MAPCLLTSTSPPGPGHELSILRSCLQQLGATLISFGVQAEFLGLQG